MMDLFSTFNPITNPFNLSMNWIMIMIPMMIFNNLYWKSNSMSTITMKMLINFIINQFKPLMKKIQSPNFIMVMMIMMIIFIYNITSLIPNTFSITTHIMINLSMGLIFWMALMMKKTTSMKNMLSNLTPMNTPYILIPFMVIIELISMLIQPFTLSIRLTANITAGHIMMILISQMYSLSIIPAILINIMMMILEIGVSLIQAYVFSMLIIMYSK